eukprot:Nitzschia sp. Nitz4//scaffold199_size41809//20673//22100//NITZ4_007453-RA/size41809-processed-gene-0.52-mRNA-1//1//CDS//3329540570//2094//frame0
MSSTTATSRYSRYQKTRHGRRDFSSSTSAVQAPSSKPSLAPTYEALEPGDNVHARIQEICQVDEYAETPQGDSEDSLQQADSRDIGESLQEEAPVEKRTGFLPIAMPRADAAKDESPRLRSSNTSFPAYALSRRISAAREQEVVTIENLEDVPDTYDVDVTDVEQIHEVATVRGDDYEEMGRFHKRHGLPYEDTDFHATDDASVDSWSDAIVGPSASTANAADVAGLIKESRSTDGALLIDLSAIEDEEMATVLASASMGGASTGTSLASSKADRNGMSTKEERPQQHRSIVCELEQATPKTIPTASLLVGVAKPAKVETPEETVPEDYFASSILYLKNFTDELGSQIGKIDLDILPDVEMQGMLGILNREVTATRDNVPAAHKEMVDFLDKHSIEIPSCGVDTTVLEGAPDLKFDSKALEDAVQRAQQTYQGVMTCGGVPRCQQIESSPIPTTLDVPIAAEYTQEAIGPSEKDC